MSTARSEAGIALLLALGVLVALGAIASSALTLARGERAAGQAAVARIQARGAAEAALTQALAGWPGVLTPPAAGDSLPFGAVVLPGPASGRALVRGLGGPLYAVEAFGLRTALAGDTLALVRLELLVLLEPPDSSGMVRPRAYPRGWRVLP